jgi:hypothetical protein
MSRRFGSISWFFFPLRSLFVLDFCGRSREYSSPCTIATRRFERINEIIRRQSAAYSAAINCRLAARHAARKLKAHRDGRQETWAQKAKEKKITLALPTDEKILVAVGKIALRHGQLDNALRMTIKDLTGVDKTEALDATARVGSRELRERIRKLARQRLGEGAALVRLQALLQRAERASKQRNEWMHAVWGTEVDGGPMIRGDDHEFQAIPNVEQLNELHDAIGEIIWELTEAQRVGFLFEALKRPALDAS